jgi:hypothetical protein
VAAPAVGGREATTDDDGRFRVDEIAFGRLDVLVIADGYSPYFGATRIGAAPAIRLERSAARTR